MAAAELQAAFIRFKRLADERKAVTLYDVFEEVPSAGETAGFPRVPPSPTPFGPQPPLGAAPAMSGAAPNPYSEEVPAT